MEFSNGKGKEWEFESDIHGNGGKRERELYKKNVRLTHYSTPELMINKWETNKKTSSKIQQKTYQGTS